MTVEEAIAIVEQLLKQGRLNKVQEIVFRQSWLGHSYMEIARDCGYESGYVKDTGSKLWQSLSEVFGERVTKFNFKVVIQRSLNSFPVSVAPLSAHQDWGEAIDTSIFYGRTAELIKLSQWLLSEHCRLVSLIGMGGIGKTALSVKLAESLQDDFDYLIWRSLRDAPPIEELLNTLLKFLSNQQETTFPENIGGKLSRLIEFLRASRCLLIFDNFESVLQSGKRVGTYHSGYEGYGELLKRVGEISHQSCLVLTSREKPQEIAALEGEQTPVRTLSVMGLEAIAGRDILATKGIVSSMIEQDSLIDHYRGNPLALKIAATTIRDLFAGDIATFLSQGSIAFNGIAALLQQHLDRLSPLEKQVMYWLAIYREPTSVATLQADIVPTISRNKLIDTLESLKWRSLIEGNLGEFTQQPVVMEYVTEQLIEQIAEEILAGSPQLLNSHALMQAQSKEYVRESQIRVIVQPLLEKLLSIVGSPRQLEHQLQQVLTQLRHQGSGRAGYGAGNLLNLFRQLGANLTGYDFSHLAIAQAYLQDVSLHGVNFAHAHFHNCAFAATFGGITSVAFSRNGQWLSTSDTNGAIQIWSVAEGRQLATCQGHNSWVWATAFSPDHKMLASCGQDHTVRLWNVATGECLQVLQGHTSIVTAIAFAPQPGYAGNSDIHVLASSSEDQTIRLWDLNTGECLQTLTGHEACVWGVSISADGETLVSGGEDCNVKIWAIATGDCLQTLSGHAQWVKTVALSPDGTAIASGSFDQTIKLWDAETGECLRTLQGHQSCVVSVAFSPDGTTLASGSYDQTVKLWQVQTGICRQTLQKHTNRVWSIAFHPEGRLLASGGDDHTARLWDVKTGQCAKTLQGHSNSIYYITLSPDQRWLASGHEDQTVKIWPTPTLADLQSDRPPIQPCTTLRGHTNRVFAIAFSNDGQTLASASFDRTIKLWNWQTGQCLQTLQGHASWIWAMALSPDGQVLASGSYDHTIKLWSAETGDCLKTLLGHTSCVLAVAFTPDSQLLISGGYEQTIKLWNVATGQCLKTCHAHSNRVWSVIVSPNGQQFATGGDDATIKIWDIHSGECLQTLTGHKGPVLSLLFTPDGELLFSGSADQTIKIWQLSTGTCLKTLPGHHNWVWSLVLNLSQNMLLSGSQDETINCWDLETGEYLQTLRPPRPYEGMNITQTSGLTEAQQAALITLGAISQPSELTTMPIETSVNHGGDRHPTPGTR